MHEKSDKYCVEIKFLSDPTLEDSDLYEFKMALFDNVEPEDFLLFVQNYQMISEASGTLTHGAKIQCLCTLLHFKLLSQIEMLSVEVGSKTTEHLKPIIIGLGTSFFPVHALSKQNFTMRRIVSNP